MSRIEPIMIDGADRDELERLVRDRNTAQKVVWRAQIVLLAADGLQAGAIAAATGKSQLTVRRWRRRFVAKGVEGLLKDASRPPRRKPLTAEKALVLSLDEKSQILLRQAQDEGAGSHPAGLADEEGAGRNLDPRLQTPWRDDAVRRPRRRDRQGHRSVHAQAS